MKTREGFVSNSSSSSFVLEGRFRTKEELISIFKEDAINWTEKICELFTKYGSEFYNRNGEVKRLTALVNCNDLFEKRNPIDHLSFLRTNLDSNHVKGKDLFILDGRAKTKEELVLIFKEDVINWIERVYELFEKRGAEVYDQNGEIKGLMTQINCESSDKFERSLIDMSHILFPRTGLNPNYTQKNSFFTENPANTKLFDGE